MAVHKFDFLLHKTEVKGCTKALIVLRVDSIAVSVFVVILVEFNKYRL